MSQELNRSAFLSQSPHPSNNYKPLLTNVYDHMARTDADVQKKGRGSRRRIVLALLALIIIAGVYLFFTYGSLPYAIITAKNLNSSTLISITGKERYAGFILRNARSIWSRDRNGNYQFGFSWNGRYATHST